MKTQKFLLCLGLLASSNLVNAASCPEKSPKEWAEYFTQRSSNLSANRQTLQNIWRDCEATFRLNGVQACAERVVKRAEKEEFNRYNGHSMGWEVSDRDYLSSVPDGYLDMPREFKDGLPSNIREIAKDKGWKVIQYDSRTVANPPNRSYGRTLVLVPGEKVDKWIQFTSDNTRGKGQLIDFVAMEKPTSPDDKAKPYYTQYMRDSNGRNPTQRQSFDNCYSCHPNGMRELSPAPGSYSAADKPVLDEMQEIMRNYTAGRGGVDWGGKIHPEEYGPPMGEAQGCVKCHNNGDGRHEFSRGAINYRHDRGHIRHKMNNDYSMPVAMTPMEQDFLKFVEDIPLMLTDTERGRFLATIAGPDEDKYEASVKALQSMGKITAEEARKWLFVVNGHPDYENCKFDPTVPDCFRGLKRYDSLYDQMIAQYPDQERAWLVEECDKILNEEIDESVNDSNRSGDDIDFNGNSQDESGSTQR